MYWLALCSLVLMLAGPSTLGSCGIEFTKHRTQKILGFPIQGYRFSHYIRSLLEETPSVANQFSRATPRANIGLSLPIQNLAELNRAVAKQIETSKTVEKMTLFDMHIPGVHSIVLQSRPEVMVRLYVVPPGNHGEGLLNWSAPFLYHPHTYHFVSIPLIGTLRNERILVHEKGGTTHGSTGSAWYRYRFESAVVEGNSKGKLEIREEVEVQSLGFENLGQGQGYMMESPEIHRVSFLPDPLNGWSVVLFFEFRNQQVEPYVYSNHLLTEIPEIGRLYNQPTRQELYQLTTPLKALLRGEL